MSILERGQVTIPKELRDRFGLGPETDVDFVVVDEGILLQKTLKKIPLRKWKGRCKKGVGQLQYSSVDKFIDDSRGQ